MVPKTLSLDIPIEDKTAAIARSIGRILKPGDTLLLDGQVGAGKTHFARALIQSILKTVEDVPSPSFTLVQTYDTTKGEVWHCDMYRIGPTDVDELGLSEAFETAICLIEWPENMGDLAPENALTLRFDLSDEPARKLRVSWEDTRWDEITEAVQDAG